METIEIEADLLKDFNLGEDECAAIEHIGTYCESIQNAWKPRK